MHDSIIQLVLVAQHPAFSPLVLGAGVELRGRDVVDACEEAIKIYSTIASEFEK